MSIQASAIINIVRDLIPDGSYSAGGVAQPDTDGGIFRVQTLYRFLNDGVKALSQKTGWVINDWTAVTVTQHIPTYDINGQWHSFDEVFLNGWRLGRAAEGYLLWPQKVETGQSVVYALHNTTDHWNLRLFPAPNFTDPSYVTSGSMTPTSTAVTINSVANMMPYGFVQIENELIQYYNITGTTLQALVRGVGGTTASSHVSSSSLTHLACWIKGVRTPNEITVSTDVVEVPPAFQYPLQLYVLARCRQSENEFGEAAKLMAEFNAECTARANDPRLKDSQGLQVRPYGDRVFGSLAWGRAVVN